MVVFTDLDGTLLDHETYSFAPALPALHTLQARGIPVVLVTSKTRSEVEALRRTMDHTGPFIVENGAAIFIPGEPPIILGRTTADARAALRAAAEQSGVQVRGFGDMPLDEIRQRSGLRPAVAELAAKREYGEPFVITAGDAQALIEPLASRGFQLTQGGRFFHVLGGCDKAQAVAHLAKKMGDPDTIGLGDAPNDLGFLQAVRRPVIIPGRYLDAMRAALPNAPVAPAPGPDGWNQAVMTILNAPSANS